MVDVRVLSVHACYPCCYCCFLLLLLSTPVACYYHPSSAAVVGAAVAGSLSVLPPTPSSLLLQLLQALPIFLLPPLILLYPFLSCVTRVVFTRLISSCTERHHALETPAFIPIDPINREGYKSCGHRL